MTLPCFCFPPLGIFGQCAKMRPSRSLRSPVMTARTAIEDRDVPEAHRGLHDTLYGAGAEREHAGFENSRAVSDVLKNITPNEICSVFEILSALQSAGDIAPKIAAVYGVYDQTGELLYVGITRNIALSLRAHVDAFGDEKVNSVRIQTFAFPRKSEMEQLKSDWIMRSGKVPEGNIVDEHGRSNSAWSETVQSIRRLTERAMTIAERSAFEEKKFKLRKAMADSTLADEVEAAELAREAGQSSSSDDLRRQYLQYAVEGDDWSGEISAQTAESLALGSSSRPARRDHSTTESDSGVPISPFENNAAYAGVQSQSEPAASMAGSETPELELNVANVDKVLDDVRPYLISDGGNVSVVSVDPVPDSGDVSNLHNGTRRTPRATISLQLEGACGSCPSSTTTMKLGIERVLREKFGDAVADIVAIADPAAALKAEMSSELCDKALDEIRPTITGLGGSVTTLSATRGHIHLQYSGPSSLKYGIELMLRDKLANVQSVVWD